MDMQTAEQKAARAGVVLTARDREKIAELQNAERERLAATRGGVGFLPWFNSTYAGFLDGLLHVANLIQALVRTVIIGAGVFAVLVLLAVVEQQRVSAGIMLFDASADNAARGAWAVVLLNLALEFVIHYEDNRNGWANSRRQVWSLRIAWQNLSYRLGVGKRWQARELPPSQWARSLLRMITFVILALALGGSMRDELAMHAGKHWLAGYIAVLTESDALLFTAWLGGLLFAIVAVYGAQGLTRYTAARTHEIIAELRQTETNDENLDDVAAAYIMAKVAKKEQRDAEKRAAQGDTQPYPLGMGNGNGRH